MTEDGAMDRAEQLAKRATELAARAEDLARQAHETNGLDEQLAQLEGELARLDAEQAELDRDFDVHLAEEPYPPRADIGWAGSFSDRIEALGEHLGDFISSTVTSRVGSWGDPDVLELACPVDGPVRVDVQSDAGGVDVVATETERVVVVATRRGGDGFPLDRLVGIGHFGGTVRIDAQQPKRIWSRRGIDLHIEVPLGSPLEVRTGGGRVNVGGTGAPVAATTGGGSVDIRDAVGQVNVRTGGGSVRIGHVDASVIAHTGGGSIHVEGRLHGDCNLKTGGGSVKVHLDPESCITVDAKGTGASTDFADLEVRNRSRIAGAIRGGGEGHLVIRTGGGSVRIHQEWT